LVAASIAFRNGVIDNQVFLACVLMVITGALSAGVIMKRVLGVQAPRELVRSRAPVLQRLDERGAPVEEIAIGNRLTIGRDPSNDLALVSDGLVSRQHAIIRIDNSKIRLEDLGSANGTQLWKDGRWREATLDEIDDGDIIVVGTNVFRVARGAR
ncbi:MAG: FHA domain-containing protein, partial [Dehalococcoidia bacterium]|nr:FHA domain-containing protein [Dehalococcoidia bacterium]